MADQARERDNEPTSNTTITATATATSTSGDMPETPPQAQEQEHSSETDPDHTIIKAPENEADRAEQAEQARIRAEEAVHLGPVDPAVQARLGDHGDLIGSMTRTTIIYTHGPAGGQARELGGELDGALLGPSGSGARDELVPGRTESFVTAMTRVDLKDQDEREDELERDEVGGAEHKVDKEVGDVIGAGGVGETAVGEAGAGVVGTTTSQPTSAVPVLPPPSATTTTTATTTPAPASTSGPSLQFATSSSTKQQQQQQAKEKEKEKTTMSLKTWWKGFSGGGSGSSNNNNATTSGNGAGNGLASTSSGGHGGNPTTGTTTTTAGPSTGTTRDTPSDQTPTTSGGLGMRLRKGSVGGEGLRGRKSSVGEGYNYLAETVPEGDVFAQPLLKSLEYASVQISTARPDGGLYIWGYVPVVVAKCGLYLKDTATEVPGTFRVSGSAKRMKELQAVFDNPPKYGKNLDWKKTTYTTHDVATILRRYLTQMPEPIVPHELYHEFRNNLLACREHTPPGENSLDETIKTYQNLIARMPKPNQYLLLYVLDLLSVFARKAEVNLMTAPNLAVIFQPGIISHTEHQMRPAEHTLSQAVLEFLIEHQDHFLLGMQLEPIASRSSDAAASSSDVFHPATSVLTSQSTRDEAEQNVAPATATPAVVVEEPATTDKQPVERITSREPTKAPTSPAPPRPPAPVRADSDLMIPSDSDDEAPVGGYYIKTEDPTRLQASIGPNGVINRSRTVMDRKSPRAIPIVQEYHSERSSVELERTKSGAGSPAKARTGGGLRAALSVRRTSRTSRVVSSNDTKPPASAREAQTQGPPGVIIVDNPPFHGGLEGTPSGSRLFRRRTAPTRRHRNKDEEEVIRKQAEEAVRKVGTGTDKSSSSRKQGSAEV